MIYKKLGVMFFAWLLVFLPVIPSYAYSGGLLNGKRINLGSDLDSLNDYTNYITDSNEVTGYNIGAFGGIIDTFWYKFDNPATITDYQIKSNASSLDFTLYDNNKNILYHVDTWSLNGVKTSITPVSKVSYVSLVNTRGSSKFVNEFDVFGYEKDETPPANVNGVQQSATDVEVNLQWNNPTDVDFAGTKIYRNGQIITTLDKLKNSFKDTNLQPSTSYIYKITTIDETGNESNGVTVEIRTIPSDWDHVSDVTNVSTTVFDDRVKMTWQNPGEQAFVEVRIFKEGVLHTVVTTPANSFIDYDLSPNTTYSFLLRSRSTTGYMSPGVTVTATTTGAPTSPKSFYANAGDGEVTLYWNGKESKQDYNFIGYHVYQDGVRITSQPIKDERYTVSGLQNEKVYKFEVTAIDDLNNESPKSSSISVMPKENIPLQAPTGLNAAVGSGMITLTFNRVIHNDLQGYYVYLDGEKHSGLITKNKYVITGLNNDQTYSLAVVSVSHMGDESALSQSISAIPYVSDVPDIAVNYDLQDVSDGIGSTFSSLWLIIAFSCAIPISLYIGLRIKELILG